jgi:uncharacterized protein Smg (DUF494 family)
MNTEVIEILVKIVEGINSNYSFDKILDNVKQINKVNRNLITAIYSWVYEKITRDMEEKPETELTNGLRFLSDEEKDIIGIDNYNYILHLYNLRLLNNPEVERIIEQAVIFPEGEFDIDKLNIMLLSIFLDTNSDLPPGSRILLYSSDTIN